MGQFGTSVLGAPLEVVEATDPSGLLVLAGIHGDEPDGVVVLSTCLRSIDKSVLRSHVILSGNPDGLSRGTRCNAQGVDLNRNWPTTSWKAQPVVHRWKAGVDKDVELSPGVFPGSEPEVRSLIELFLRLRPAQILSIHSPLACVDDPVGSSVGKELAGKLDLPLVEDIGYPTPGSLGLWGRENGIVVTTLELPSESILSLRERCESALIDLLVRSHI